MVIQSTHHKMNLVLCVIDHWFYSKIVKGKKVDRSPLEVMRICIQYCKST